MGKKTTIISYIPFTKQWHDARKQNTKKAFFLNLLFVCTIGLLLLLFYFYIWLPFITNHNEKLVLPDLKGMHINDASAYLNEKKLQYEIFDSAYTAKIKPNHIIKQHPKAGQFVKKERKIYLVIKSSSPQMVIMPNLKDGSLKNAELILGNLGLKKGRITYRPDLAKNAVLKQLHKGKPINSGTKVAKGEKIDLVVGSGFTNAQNSFPLPSYIKHNVQQAVSDIRRRGLNYNILNIIIYPDDNGIGEYGIIIGQYPSSQTIVQRRDIISLSVNCKNPQDSARIAAQFGH